MPYIKPEARKFVDPFIEELSIAMHLDVGELNYIITKLCLYYLKKTDHKYVDYNAIIGVLECAKQEFYRRQVAAYEDKKIIENGEVY